MSKRITFSKVLKLDPIWVCKKIDQFLCEDMPEGDLTTESTVSENRNVVAQVIAAEEFVFCGEQVLPYCFSENCSVELNIRDGEKVSTKTLIADISGPAKDILLHERVMLNLLSHICGISSETRKCIDLGLPEGFLLLDTRKTTPGLRLFEKYAVAVGGGTNHRLDLSSAILIKDNHIHSAGGVKKVIATIKSGSGNSIPIELEVDTFDQLREGLDCDVDGFLLDNMDPAEVREAVKIIRSHRGGEDIFVEASGGIDYKSLQQYAVTGIDAVSMSSLTIGAKAVDIKMDFV